MSSYTQESDVAGLRGRIAELENLIKTQKMEANSIKEDSASTDEKLVKVEKMQQIILKGKLPVLEGKLNINQICYHVTYRLNERLNYTKENVIMKPQQPALLLGVVSPETSAHGAKYLGIDTVLLIICSNRPEYLKRSLDRVVAQHPISAVPILISEDGHSSQVAQVNTRPVTLLYSFIDLCYTITR
jgi:hypothetical protein